jgi:hypothetical protein
MTQLLFKGPQVNPTTNVVTKIRYWVVTRLDFQILGNESWREMRFCGQGNVCVFFSELISLKIMKIVISETLKNC